MTTVNLQKLKPKHSVLLAYLDPHSIDVNMIRGWLRDGIKVIIINTKRNNDFINTKLGSDIKDAEESGFLSIHESKGELKEFVIEDGKIRFSWDEIDSIIKNVPTFNINQYRVEHAPIDYEDVILVQASAGTGKTTVMVDRVMFLLDTIPDLRPKDITMVTFTREAAKHMREKIIEKIVSKYEQTGSLRYLQIMEEACEMQISTIHSFFKKVIQKKSLDLGYGTNLSIRSFTHEKKVILRDVINELFTTNNGLKDRNIPIYRYRDLAFECWEKLEEKGYFEKDIENIHFGNDDSHISYSLKIIIQNAVKQYEKLKREENAISISDFNKETEELQKIDKSSNISGFNTKFLFIDEFQDTDNSQINSIAWLRRNMHCQLFVVGDVKQSIYRFRGADERAFNQLLDVIRRTEKGTCRNRDFELFQNYRTSNDILIELNKVFQYWMQEGWLPESKEARLGKDFSGDIEYKDYMNEDNLKPQLMESLKEELDQPSDDDNPLDICILNRRNSEVKKIVQWCQEVKIPCVAQVDGGFYQEPAVLDVYHLLAALLYPRDTARRYNYLMTSYSAKMPCLSDISNCCGNEKALHIYLQGLSDLNHWNEMQRQMSRRPFFQLMREIIEREKPAHRYYLHQKYNLIHKNNFKEHDAETQASYERDTYNLNLNKLMQIFYDTFKSEYSSFWSAYNLLKMRCSTDSQEDSVYPDLSKGKKGAIIQVMTVHKAKGLEFDTVVMPFLNTSFWQDLLSSSKISKNIDFNFNNTDGKLSLGWFLYYPQARDVQKYHNDYYDKNKKEEHNAVFRDEARILYVGLTRAKRRLYCYIQKTQPRKDTWAFMIQLGRNH